MSSELAKIFENNWEDIKPDLKSIWSKLTKKDLEEIDGSYNSLVNKIKNEYGSTKAEIEEELNNFFSEEGIEEVKKRIKKIKTETKEKAGSFIEIVQNYVSQYLRPIKDKTISLEENAVEYVKENPIKILGIAAIASFTLIKIINNSEN